jgi:hypothetical protein
MPKDYMKQWQAVGRGEGSGEKLGEERKMAVGRGEGPVAGVVCLYLVHCYSYNAAYSRSVLFPSLLQVRESTSCCL